MGSVTSPPCAENVVWFVVHEPQPIGSTSISMIRDALCAPGKSPHDKEPNYDGSNLEEIAFLIGNKKEETFRLLIDSIEVK